MTNSNENFLSVFEAYFYNVENDECSMLATGKQ